MSVSFSSGVSIENGVRLVQPPAMISISSQPTNNTVNYGANGRFAVTAAITRGAPLSYQWQKQENSTGSWVNISGATTSSYNVASAVYPDDDNDSYRVVMTGGLNANTLTSNSATLSVTPSVITITNQSSLINTSANETDRITFSVNASITLDATLSYQWQRQDSGSATWNDVINGSFSSYTTGFLTNADDNGDSYRVRISGTKGATTVYSNTATLTVNVASYPNSFVTANENNFFGAGDGTQSYFLSGTAFGEITSDYISSIAYYGGTEVGGKTIVELKEGTHTGTYDTFTVTNGAIDGDGPGDMRGFYINNTYYMFQYDGSDAYFRNYKLSDTLYLPDSVGTRSSITYPEYYQVSNQAEALGVYPGIKPDTITYNNTTYYGFSIDSNEFPIFGYAFNLDADYFKRIVYDGTNTVIRMNPGQYDLGGSNTFTVQANNAIGGDTTGSSRYFKVSGNNYTFTYSSSTGLYSKSGDDLGLYNAVGQGQTLTIVYDPSNQPAQGGGGGSSGSYTAGTDYADGTNGPPGVRLGNVMGQPSFMVTPSAWTNTTGRDALIALTSGATVSVVVDGTTYTVTLTANMTENYSIYYAPATFSPSLSFPDPWSTYLPSSVSTGSGAGSGGTFVAETDFDPGTNGPPGLSIGGQVGQYTITVFNSGWTNTTARDLILSKPSGTVFTAIVGGYTRTVTMTSGWTSFNGGAGSYAPVTADGNLYGATTSITVPGGSSGSGGGGGTTNVSLWNGAWDTSGLISFQVQASDTANINKMDGIPSGATLTITDINNNTTTVTLLGGLNKFGPGGPPSNQRYFWDGTATTTNPSFPDAYGFITSLTYNT
jgi:hypothetical protein